MGLAKAFKFLDVITKKGILENARQNISFSYGLGHGLAVNFVSLQEQLQNEILKLLQDSSIVSFSDGFSKGLNQSFEYLSKDHQEQLLQVCQQSTRVSVTQSVNKIQKNGTDMNDTRDNCINRDS
jgi:hypothetical protein